MSIQQIKKIVSNSKILPKERNRCSVSYYKNKLYIYGGFNGNYYRYSDLWCFDLNKYTYTQLQSYNECNQHESIIYKHYLIIIGGCKTYFSKNGYDSNIRLYNINTNKWNTITFYQNNYKPKIESMNISLQIINEYLIIYASNSFYVININNAILNNKGIWKKFDTNFCRLRKRIFVYDKYYNRILCFDDGRNIISLYNASFIVGKCKIDDIIIGFLRRNVNGILIPKEIQFIIQNFCGLIEYENKMKIKREIAFVYFIDKKKLILGEKELCESKQSNVLYHFYHLTLH